LSAANWTTFNNKTTNTGTVTSVSTTVQGSAMNIGGSPITSSGTLAFGFAGGVGEYIDGAGDLQGDISQVIAGTGMTGGGTSGAVTLNVAAGLGITANPDNVAVNMGAFSTTNLAEGTNQYFTTARANTAIAAYTGALTNLTGNVNTTGNISCGNIAVTSAKILNLNSITSKADNDKFTFKALLGGSNTVTNSGNITSDGYEVIIDSSHTYATSGNVSQTGTNNLNGFAVSGAFVKGSPNMSITGVTQLKNVFNYSANIDGTNNNTGLTSSMVAGMIMDNSNGVDGSQYPLPQGTTLTSANATTLVFSQSAVASQTFANTSSIAIVHGGKDAKNGQLVSFVSQDDATADGTVVNTIAAGGAGGMIKLSDAGESPGTGETSDSLLMGLSPAVSIPVGTGVTFAGVTGTGASNLNGQTLFIRRDVFGDNGNYTLTTDVGGTTAATQTAFGTVSFNTGGGNITYTSAQSTSVISKSRLYVKDAYGYPKVGPKQTDFAYTIGSASDYLIDYSAATKNVRGRTSLEATKQTLKAPFGMTIGENTTMSNRGDGDTLANFGLNFVWDGLIDYSTLYQGTTSNIVPQMLFKNYTDNTFGATSSGKGRGGPRLFFGASTGNINTSEFDKYPRKSQEIGRMMFWGPTQSVGDSMSTVNPAGFISATASEDWTTSNKLEMSFAANGDGLNNGDVFLNYRNGKVVLASGSNGSTTEAIHFAPAVPTTTGNAAQTYATLGHTWASVNYANVSVKQGSKVSITQGTTLGSQTGDLTLAFDREYIAGTDSTSIGSPASGGVINGGTEAGDGGNIISVVWSTSESIPDGSQFNMSGVTGPGNATINATTYYTKASNLGANGVKLYLDPGLTTASNAISTGVGTAFDASGTGNGTATWVVTGTAAKEWQLSLDAGSNDLELKSEAVTKVTFTDNYTELAERLRLKSYTTTQVNALASPAAGDVVFNTTLNLVCVYNGSGWRKLNDAAM